MLDRNELEPLLLISPYIYLSPNHICNRLLSISILSYIPPPCRAPSYHCIVHLYCLAIHQFVVSESDRQSWQISPLQWSWYLLRIMRESIPKQVVRLPLQDEGNVNVASKGSWKLVPLTRIWVSLPWSGCWIPVVDVHGISVPSAEAMLKQEGLFERHVVPSI
jgi:hypothetical protein